MSGEESAADARVDYAGDAALREPIVDALKTVYDPEIPADIYELGLVYGIHVDEANHVRVRMTLTSPACPAAEIIPVEVKNRVQGVEGVSGADVEIVWDPPWTQDFMSEAARLQLGMF